MKSINARPLTINIQILKLAFAGCVAIFELSSCGGGGSGGGIGPVTSTLSFPLQSAEIASIMRGSSTNYTVSGDCNGTASMTSSTPVAASFEAATGVSVTTTSTISLTNCYPSSTTG
ncbi:MAG TPA: hypothetical protein VMJ33_05625, partial [Gallionella sp.]|nr:hypothetical protein [Gallionella sp.]